MKAENLLLILTVAAMLAGVYCAFLYAPTESSMGEVQRIFYFHVPSAWVSFLGIFVVFLSSAIFLSTGKRIWDIRASAAAEIGALFCTLVLISGPLWAKPVWGIYWTWDARLTSSFVLWLIYLGYLLLRRLLESPQQRARLSAVFGIMGAIDVPIVYMSNRWWRTQHPAPVVGGGEGSGLEPSMLLTLMVCLAAFTLLFFYLWRVRCRLDLSSDRLEALERHLLTHIQEER